MATEKLRKFNEYEKHATGNLNSWKIRTLNHGATVTENIDNFTIVELGFGEDGERTASQLTDVANKGYLIATPERRYMNESIDEFFNGEGEMARIIYLDEGVRFQTSAFTPDGDVTAGQNAHFDPATKKFLLHDGTHADYATAEDKFVVVDGEDDLEYTLGAPLVKLEVL